MEPSRWWIRLDRRSVQSWCLFVVVAAGLGWMVAAAAQGGSVIAEESSPGAVSLARARLAWDLCVQDAIRERVPSGASVWVVPKGDLYWQYSLGPMSTPNHEVLTEPRSGAYSLRVIGEQPGYENDAHCAGRPGTRYRPVILLVRRL